MLNPYHNPIDIEKVFQLQDFQYSNALYLEENVPAQSQLDASVDITTQGHFMMTWITGAFTTLDGEDTDNGISQMWIQLVDGSNDRTLFNNFIWVGLWTSPGRIQAIPGTAASNQLYLTFPFVYTFPQKGSILVKIRNNHAYANTVKLMFTGIRIFPRSRQDM